MFPRAKAPGSSAPDELTAVAAPPGSADLLQFYRAYGGIVFARCRMLLGNDTAAEDATQETFLRVQRHFRRKLPGPDNALAWLYRIATNHCLNEIRNARIRPLPMAAIPERAGEDLRERLAHRDLAERLVWAAPAPLRTAAWLFHVDGMEQEEIARLLGCSRRTVAARLAKFAAFGRKFLERSGS
jgi:RNA polymerase sigma-70 factor (ECF subfamily)